MRGTEMKAIIPFHLALIVMVIAGGCKRKEPESLPYAAIQKQTGSGEPKRPPRSLHQRGTGEDNAANRAKALFSQGREAYQTGDMPAAA